MPQSAIAVKDNPSAGSIDGGRAERRVPDGRDFLDRAAVAGLTAEELTRRTAALAPLIASKAAEAERLRRPDRQVWSALRASGFFYQFVPKAFGGMGADPEGFMDAALPIARACPSTGWNACFCAGHNRHLAQFPRATQAELWGGEFPYIVAPMLGLPPGKAVRAEGGYRVSGRWSWASGIMDADWAFGATLLAEGDGPPQMMIVLFPAAEAEVIDTWQVDGLAGSGSNDVRVDDLFVPEARTLNAMDFIAGSSAEARRHPEPVFRIPAVAFSGFAASVPVLGAAQGALDLYRRRLAQRVDKFTNSRLSDHPLHQYRLARADVTIRAAETLIREAGRKAVSAAALQGADQVKLRIEIRAQIAHAVTLCHDAVLALAEGAGSSAHRLDDPFQRYVRDLSIMASHVGFNLDQAYELQGRALLGLEPHVPLF